MFAFQGVMVTMRRLLVGALLTGLGGPAAQAATDPVVQCRSHDWGYTECPAQGLEQPQLIYQISSSACTVNRTWGFDRSRGLLWVDDGCAGRFGDVGGYHHGRTGKFDPGARRYTAHGEDAGPFVGGQALGALFEGASSSAMEGGNTATPADGKGAPDKTPGAAPAAAAPNATAASAPEAATAPAPGPAPATDHATGAAGAGAQP